MPLYGMSGQFHMGRGTDIVVDPSLIKRHLDSFPDDEQEAEYLRRLPVLIEQTAVQEAECIAIWNSNDPQRLADYPPAREKLANLCLDFQFPLRSYERITRQPDKTYLKLAKELLETGVTEGLTIEQLQVILRMTLREFVEAEQATADDLQIIDVARAQAVLLHNEFAREAAESICGQNAEAFNRARSALVRAAQKYSPRRGYGFRDYAIHWIEAALRNENA